MSSPSLISFTRCLVVATWRVCSRTRRHILLLAALPPFLRDALHEARDRFWNRLRPAFPLRDRHRVDAEGFSHLDLGERQALANPFQFVRLHAATRLTP